MQELDRALRGRLRHVGNDHMTHIFPVDRHMDNRPRMVAGMPFRTDGVHQLLVAGINRVPVDEGANTLPGDFLHILHHAVVRLVRVGGAQRSGDRMRRIALDMSGQVQKFLFFDHVGMNRRNVEHALRQRAGLIENHRLRVRQKLQIARALDQDAVRRRAADAREERKRHGNHERAGAADDKQDKRALDPDRPVR